MAERLKQFARATLDPAVPMPPGIVGPDGKPSVRRFSVYRNNVVVSLIEALRASYPVVQRLVGEDFFQAMSRVFVSGRLPSSPVMLSYGEGFSEFIRSFPPVAALPYLADVAQLERAWAESYHAAEARSLVSDDLREVDPSEFAAAQLTFHPSVRLISSRHPIVTIWEMNLPGGSPRQIELTREENAVIARPRAEVEVRRVSAATAAFLLALMDGKPSAMAATAGLKLDPQFDLSGTLRNVFASGLVSAWVPAGNAGDRANGR